MQMHDVWAVGLCRWEGGGGGGGVQLDENNKCIYITMLWIDFIHTSHFMFSYGCSHVFVFSSTTKLTMLISYLNNC